MSDSVDERSWLLLQSSMKGLDKTLRAALLAACIPHRLDKEFLAALQRTDTASAGAALDQLAMRGFARSDLRGYQVDADVRRHLLARLWQSDQRQFEALNNRAAAYLASLGRDDANRYAAYIYHVAAERTGIARPEGVLNVVRETFSAWGGSPHFAADAAEAIPHLLAEAVEAGRYAGPPPETRELWAAMLDRSTGKTRVALALGGGGSVCAYHAGVYNALHDAGIEPDWVAGESMAALIGAVIAGNAPDRRLSQLHALWSTLAPGTLSPNQFLTRTLGVPGLYGRYMLGGTTTCFDLSPARATLERFVDFDLLNSGPIRYAVSAVNVATGDFTVFDNTQIRIRPEHVLASMAVPPGFVPIEIDGEAYWGATLASGSALQHILAGQEDGAMVVYQPYLFAVSDGVPASLPEMQAMRDAIIYRSRARLIADYYANLQRSRAALRQALERMPEAARTQDDTDLLADLVAQPRVSLVNLVYRQRAVDIASFNTNYDRTAIAEHWQRGRDDAARALARIPTSEAGEGSGITVDEVDEERRADRIPTSEADEGSGITVGEVDEERRADLERRLKTELSSTQSDVDSIGSTRRSFDRYDAAWFAAGGSWDKIIRYNPPLVNGRYAPGHVPERAEAQA